MEPLRRCAMCETNTTEMNVEQPICETCFFLLTKGVDDEGMMKVIASLQKTYFKNTIFMCDMIVK